MYCPMVRGKPQRKAAPSITRPPARCTARSRSQPSPVATAGRLYLQTEDGECYVIRQGPAFEILAVNKLDETFCASPAVSGGKLFLRGRKHLYCIGK